MERYERIVNEAARHSTGDWEPWPSIDRLEVELLGGSDHEEDRFLERFDRHLWASGRRDARLFSRARLLARRALWEMEPEADWARLDVDMWLRCHDGSGESDDGHVELAQAFVSWLGSEGRLSARGLHRLRARVRLHFCSRRPVEQMARAA